MAAKPLALVSADWHVRKGDRVWANKIPALSGDVAYSIEQITEIAEKYDVSYVFLAGDILEKQTQTSDVAQILRSAMDTFKRREQHVFYVQGQHELADPPWLSAVHDWPRYAKVDEVVTVGDFAMRGCDYLPLDKAEDVLKGLPAADILLTHQVWNHPEYLGSRGYVDTAWVPAEYKMVITGDYHVHQDNYIDNKVFLSPGSIAMQKIDEDPSKWVYILYDDLTYKSVQLRTRSLYSADIDTEENLQSFIDNWEHRNPTGIDVPLYRIRYFSEIPGVVERLRNCVGAEAHLYLDPFRAATTSLDVESEELRQVVVNTGLEGCIRKYYEGAEGDLAVRLLNTNNVEEEIDKIFKELTAEDA